MQEWRGLVNEVGSCLVKVDLRLERFYTFQASVLAYFLCQHMDQVK